MNVSVVRTVQLYLQLYCEGAGGARLFGSQCVRELWLVSTCGTPQTLYSNEAILRKIPKTSFWARFGPFWPKNGQMDFFLKNRAPSVFYTCGPLTSCKNSEKTNEPILRKARHGQTDRLTEAIL